MTKLFFLFTAGLPDGKFSNQKSQFGEVLEGHELENILWSFGSRSFT
jgi:hypothetical protein